MGARFSAVRDAYHRFQDAKSDALALGHICIIHGFRFDAYEEALESYSNQRNQLRLTCTDLVAYYNMWINHAQALLLILRSLEMQRSGIMSRPLLELHLKLLRDCSEILQNIEQILADLDLNNDENGEVVQDDTAVPEAENEHNQDLPDTDSEGS